jgi:hypothetical protein
MAKPVRTRKMLLAASIPAEDYGTLQVMADVLFDGNVEKLICDIIARWKSRQLPEMVEAGKRLVAEWEAGERLADIEDQFKKLDALAPS